MAAKFSEINESINWKDITPGGIITEGGTSKFFKTGDWRTEMPEFIEENCKQCLLCAPVCPDACIPVTEGKRGAFDLDHCKGCGICAKVCPFSAIKMVKEDK